MGILEKAKEVTDGQRRQDYGSMEKGHEIISDLWTAYLNAKEDRNLKPFDVAMMMILMKVARNAHKPTEDNLVDIAGYARCAAKIAGFEGGEDYVTAAIDMGDGRIKINGWCYEPCDPEDRDIQLSDQAYKLVGNAGLSNLRALKCSECKLLPTSFAPPPDCEGIGLRENGTKKCCGNLTATGETLDSAIEHWNHLLKEADL